MIPTGLVGKDAKPARNATHSVAGGETKMMTDENNSKKKNIAHSVAVRSAIFVIGYLLSPFSFWNDAVVNVPIAYFLAQIVKLVKADLFMPAFVAFYWLTNVIGILMMHSAGKTTLILKKKKVSYLITFLAPLLYTLIIIVLAQLNVIKSPLEYLGRLPGK